MHPCGAHDHDPRLELDGSIRVLVADGAETVRAHLTELLAAAAGIEVVGTAEDGRLARSAVVALNPDVVLLAAELPGSSGPETTAWLRANRPGVRVVALAPAGDADHATRTAMRQAGAVTTVPPDASAAEITAAILTAVAAP